MKPLKEGDKVRVRILDSETHFEETGTGYVRGILGAAITVQMDTWKPGEITVHRCQCRKLIKRDYETLAKSVVRILAHAFNAHPNRDQTEDAVGVVVRILRGKSNGTA